MDFNDYEVDQFYDELIDENGSPRSHAAAIISRIESIPSDDILHRQEAAEIAFMNMGITFTVYGSDEGTEKIFPFDIIPRLVERLEWEQIETGLKQRIEALNCFIHDIYNDQKILKDGVVPTDLIESSKCFLKPCIGLKPPHNIWCHITGTDLVRDEAGKFYVLEDNLRCPSGVSYVLENRQILKRTFPKVFHSSKVLPVDDYPNRLFNALQHLTPEHVTSPTIGVLTPGVYNSAYFEHSFLAMQMGVELVEGRDLVVQDNHVYMKTTKGLQKIDVLYRRIDDTFLDPMAFNPESLLGVPGIMDVYKKGGIALANAPGTGIADDKAVYAYVDKIIKYYLNEEMIIPNVPTYICREEEDRKYVLDNIGDLVVKAVNESGGYGMLVGPHSTKEQQDQMAKQIVENPRNYIAQPTLSLSRSPIIVGDHFEGRHVDLRPYIIYGKDIYVLPGGLTRVALKKGSLVVNSSQGGGSKDTWVITATEEQAQKWTEIETPTEAQTQTQTQS